MNPYSIILQAVVGSTVHGTAVKDGLEDLDLMAIVLEELDTFAGFGTKDTWTHRTKPQGVRSEAGDVDWVGYGLRKYLSLALKGNPSILLALFVPQEHLTISTLQGIELRALAPSIASKAAYAPFRGYMRQQYERLIGIRGQRNVTRPELVEKYGFDTKYASHIVRLGLQGAEFLQTGRISLPMRPADRELCVRIRNGGLSFEEVCSLVPDVEQRLLDAHLASPLPEQPDSAAVERWMLSTYRKHWSESAPSTRRES